MASPRFLVFLSVLSVILPVFLLLRTATARQYDHVEAAVASGASNRNQESSTTWAVLVAGSNNFYNYRHQADVCHAYQVLKNGGIKDENIIVFMYDDIAGDPENPTPGIIINRPDGEDVYAGVPKDYTGKEATVENFYAVILGKKAGVKGGSGKVVDSKPNDRIFIYYSDHGGPGILTMPNKPDLHAKDFIEVLKKKHGSRTYKEMVIYVEACESGSIFEGLLPQNMNIYVTTASNAEESSWATYCSTPGKYDGICLGDLYSVAWMEHSDTHNRKSLKLQQQYTAVKQRTSMNNTYEEGSHVMEYGDKKINQETLDLFQGFEPNIGRFSQKDSYYDSNQQTRQLVMSEDVDLHFLWKRYKTTEKGPKEKTKILEQITEVVKHRNHLDGSVRLIAMLLFGPSKHNSILKASRAPGSPLVDDWQCHKFMIQSFETHCGSLTQYGLKHARAFANFCNNGISEAAMEEASRAACSGHDLGQWDPKKIGFTA